MELIPLNDWTLWWAAVATAIIGQIIVISGDGIARIATGTVTTLTALLAAVYAAGALGHAATTEASALFAAGALALAYITLQGSLRQLAATSVAAAGVGLLVAFTTTIARAAQTTSW